MRYFFHIAYQGGDYSGWQRHPDGINVQQIFETALTRLLKTRIAVMGCGRTDAQVHASQFFFHADIESDWDFDLLFRLNKVLPDDIAVFDIIPMEGLPHARFDAIQRSYDYFIHTYKDPFLSRSSSLYPLNNPDIDQMQQAVALLPLYDDYRAFCKSPDRNEHTICRVSAARLNVSANGSKLHFYISANRFLGKMVRTIVGKLIEVGTGRLTVAEFKQCLVDPNTETVITPAYPQGLYLSKVTYPYLDLPVKADFGLSPDVFLEI